MHDCVRSPCAYLKGRLAPSPLPFRWEKLPVVLDTPRMRGAGDAPASQEPPVALEAISPLT